MIPHDRKKAVGVILGMGPKPEEEAAPQPHGDDFLKSIAQDLIQHVHEGNVDGVVDCLKAFFAEEEASEHEEGDEPEQE